MTETTHHENDPQEPVTITDKRRIDPETGEVRTPGQDVGDPAPDATSGALPPEPAAPDTDEVAELKATLQRVKAEYDNYRKRTLRDQQMIADRAKVGVVSQLLPILDDLDRARSHGDLDSGPLKAVADKLTGVLDGLGLAGFGEEGEPFDPALHEAVQHEGEGTHPVVGTVMRRGYKVGEQVVRHAMVGVVDTVPDAGGDGTGAQSEPTQDAQ